MEIFFIEPTAIHFVREISKRINLAPTSVKNHIKNLLKDRLIIKKESHPFDGFIANRENEKFLFYKRLYNFYTLDSLKKELVEILHPSAIILFGSYLFGEDIENSDIDILILSKKREEISLERFEKMLRRRINLLIIGNLNKLDKNIQKKAINGFVLYGEIDG